MGALSAGVLIGLSLSVVASIDLFAGLHLARKITLIGPVVVACVGLVARDRGSSLLIVAAGVILRCGLVYQPAYGYQDVEIHRRVAAVSRPGRSGALAQHGSVSGQVQPR